MSLYDALVELTGSPVATINRAIAVAELEGAKAGVLALDGVGADPRVGSYQPYWAAGPIFWRELVRTRRRGTPMKLPSDWKAIRRSESICRNAAKSCRDK